MNTITVNFLECTPAPANGYNLKWRVAGSGDPYTDEGNFSSSPAVFIDNVNPEGTCYEGILQSDCSESGESGELLGNEIQWSTICPESGTGYSISLQNDCGSQVSVFEIEGGTPGDVLTVRAYYQGSLTKAPDGFQTKAAVTIFSTGGTYDLSESPCYSDELPHSFNITADTVLTMPSDTAIVTTTAETFKSLAGFTLLQVAIIDINGDSNFIYANGCSANTDTNPSC